MKRRQRERGSGGAAKLEMTPMIDVVFQLLIFFVVTLKQEDLLSHLDVSRPMPDPEARDEVPDLLKITVLRHGYLLQHNPRKLEQMEKDLAQLASYSKRLSVIIQCVPESPHKNLVELLNVCAKVGLSNLSVFSL